MTVEDFILRLDAVRRTSRGYVARCPAHQDKNPSLSVTECSDRILLYCFALCETPDIVAAVGLTMADLFFDAPISPGRRPIHKPPKLDRVALAFRFELAALDRRLRADRIVEAGKKLDVASLSDADLDHALHHAAQAHADVERAALLAGVADDLRIKEFLERDHETRQRVA